MPLTVFGLDVSKETLDVSIYDGNKHIVKVIENKPSKFNSLLKNVSTDEAHIVMEATGVYHLRVAMSAYEKGFKVSVVNPLIIRRYREMKMMRVKTDPSDAKLVAEYGYEQKPDLFTPVAKERLAIIQLLKSLEDLDQIKLSLTNRLESFDHGNDSAPIVKKSLSSIHKKIDDEKAKLEKELSKIISDYFFKFFKVLTKIPCVGKKTAATIIGYYGNFESFKTAKQAVSYSGLNPHPRQSGKSYVGSSSISKKGHALIRKALYMSALSGIRCNPEYREYYQKKLEAGKKRKKP